MTEDEMVGQYHQLNEHEFAQTLGGGEGQGCIPGIEEWDTTKGLNNLGSLTGFAD